MGRPRGPRGDPSGTHSRVPAQCSGALPSGSSRLVMALVTGKRNTRFAYILRLQTAITEIDNG